jgi:LysE type translocator
MEVMHDPAQVIAFVTFSAVVAGTPGPSNVLLTAVGARAGVRRGLASLLGQVAGMGAMLFAITLGLGNVLLAHPVALQVLKWGGAGHKPGQGMPHGSTGQPIAGSAGGRALPAVQVQALAVRAVDLF